jgi:hypothetical protein
MPSMSSSVNKGRMSFLKLVTVLIPAPIRLKVSAIAQAIAQHHENSR